MPRLQQPRIGNRLIINDREIPFSFWPLKNGQQTQIFSNDPWNIIESVLLEKCKKSRLKEAISFFKQSQDYYSAANNSSILAAKPVQTYYCLLNLIKSYLLLFSNKDSLATASHGLSENNLSSNTSNHFLTYIGSTPRKISIFNEILNLMSPLVITDKAKLQITNIYPQLILGHRLWCNGTNSTERFLRVASIHYFCDKQSKEIWLRLHIFKDDLTRQHVNHRQLLHRARLSRNFHEIDCHQIIENRETICLEDNTPLRYSRQPANKLSELSMKYKYNFWQVILNIDPYKKNYLYLTSNPNELIFPQLVSIYIMSYYLGSMTRYRPVLFEQLVNSKLGPQIKEFINYQIIQFIYLVASEFAKREISKPAIV